MSGGFQADLAKMHAASEHVGEVNQQIQSQLSSLLDKLDPLKAAYQGESAMAFNSLVQRWHEDATQLNQSLRSIGESLLQVHGNIQNKEEEAKQSFDSITGRLG